MKYKNGFHVKTPNKYFRGIHNNSERSKSFLRISFCYSKIQLILNNISSILQYICVYLCVYQSKLLYSLKLFPVSFRMLLKGELAPILLFTQENILHQKLSRLLSKTYTVQPSHQSLSFLTADAFTNLFHKDINKINLESNMFGGCEGSWTFENPFSVHVNRSAQKYLLSVSNGTGLGPQNTCQ